MPRVNVLQLNVPLQLLPSVEMAWDAKPSGWVQKRTYASQIYCARQEGIVVKNNGAT
jgi:hypothetical protein